MKDFVDNILNSGLETTATVTFLNGNTKAIKVVFEKRFRDESIVDMTAENYVCRAYAKLSDIPTIRQGDEIAIAGTEYQVSGREYDEELVVLQLTEK